MMQGKKYCESDFYHRIKLLGQGSFGKAYLVQSKIDKKYYVIKKMSLQNMSAEDQKQTVKEAKILEALKHPNIIGFKEVYYSKQSLSIVMEYANGGDLAQMIEQYKKNGVLIPEKQILDWFTQLSLAIKHVHDRKIIHRDLKTANIFLTDTGIIKLGDFGIAKILQNTRENAKTILGTPYYLSPEIIESKPYSFQTDIWSLGIILYELCALNTPFNGDSIIFLALKIVKGQFEEIPKQYSNELRCLIRELIVVDQKKRITIDEIFKKPVIIRRVNQFLDEQMKKQEFNQRILYKQNIIANMHEIPTESQVFTQKKSQEELQIQSKQLKNQVNQLYQDATARDFQFNKYIREKQKERDRQEQYPDYLQNPTEKQTNLPTKSRQSKESEQKAYEEQLKKQREEYHKEKQKIFEKQKSFGISSNRSPSKEKQQQMPQQQQQQQYSAKKKVIEQPKNKGKDFHQKLQKPPSVPAKNIKKATKQTKQPATTNNDPVKKEQEKQQKKEQLQKKQEDLKQFLEKKREEKKINKEVQIEWIGAAKLSLEEKSTQQEEEEEKINQLELKKAQSEQQKQVKSNESNEPEQIKVKEEEDFMIQLKSIVLFPASIIQSDEIVKDIDDIGSIDSLEREDEDQDKENFSIKNENKINPEEEKSLQFMKSGSKLEALRILLVDIFGAANFNKIHDILKNMLKSMSIEEIEKKYQSNQYKDLFPFADPEAISKNFSLIFTYIILEGRSY